MILQQPLSAFSAYGIELEYMLVDRQTLAVRPIADELLRRMAGHDAADVERGPLGWSNELVLHVIEIKNLEPIPMLEALPRAFQQEIGAANTILEALDARLMPTGMHPWMDPATQTQLWPHDNADIYGTFDRIFNCRSHGWANLQSMHINLPFADDLEFARLHAAVRLVLPLLPALAASSPLRDGKKSGQLDSRLSVYGSNTKTIPSIGGDIIPEPVTGRADYETRILAPMYRDIAPYDPDRVLCHEWLNSRGAIARFQRNAIEIRLADTQECPVADIAIACATIAVVRALYAERWMPLQVRAPLATEALAAILSDCTEAADQTMIDDAAYLQAFGYPHAKCRAEELWQHAIDTCGEPVCSDGNLSH